MIQVRIRHLVAIAALCLLVLVGCASPTPTPTPAPDAAPTINWLEVNIPMQAPLPDGAELLPDQLIISGGLYVRSEDSCLRFREDTSESEYTPIWPSNFVPATDPVTGGIMVLNPQGNLAARTGVDFSMSGSEMTAEEYEALWGVPLDTDCGGPFWMVSQVFLTAPE